MPPNDESAPPVTLRARVLRAFEVSSAERVSVVTAMFEGHVRRAASYWVNLALATIIATLGLVLGSTGVVIGAVLITPVMGPLVGLGMGLAAGYLVSMTSRCARSKTASSYETARFTAWQRACGTASQRFSLHSHPLQSTFETGVLLLLRRVRRRVP